MSNFDFDEDFEYNSEKNYDEATIRQQQIIENEINSTQSLIGPRINLNNLESEFITDNVYLAKVQILKRKYCSFRRIRGDGNCFFRAFGFACLERLITHKEECKKFRIMCEKSKNDLIALGFPECTIEDFHSIFMEVINKVENNCSVEDLVEAFNDQSTSDYIVVYLRLLVSGHLKKESDFFSCFVEGNRTISEFCAQEVEPMAKESDQIHIIALTVYTGVGVRIEYLDRSGNNTHHDFPEDTLSQMILLYRPGHYDILYEH